MADIGCWSSFALSSHCVPARRQRDNPRFYPEILHRMLFVPEPSQFAGTRRTGPEYPGLHVSCRVLKLLQSVVFAALGFLFNRKSLYGQGRKIFLGFRERDFFAARAPFWCPIQQCHRNEGIVLFVICWLLPVVDKKVTPKRRRSSAAGDLSPPGGGSGSAGSSAASGGGSAVKWKPGGAVSGCQTQTPRMTVPLSERQQLALLMQMTAEEQPTPG